MPPVCEFEGYETMSNKLRLSGSLAFCLAVFGTVLFLCAVAASPVATAQSALSSPQEPAIENSLEGVKFVGPFGAEDETNPKQDTFTFKDGKGSSPPEAAWSGASPRRPTGCAGRRTASISLPSWRARSTAPCATRASLTASN
jgi:hypothetical protein